MTPSLKHAVRRRGYRERNQAPQRAHVFRTLEKKRGWRERSLRYRRQQKLIQSLAEKARTKNPSEFSCRILRASQIGGGVEGLRNKQAGLVALAQRDLQDSSRKTPGAAAQSLADIGRIAASSNLVSLRSQRRLKRELRAAKDALEEAGRKAQNLLLLKQQTLRRRLKKEVTDLAADCAARVSARLRNHIFFPEEKEKEEKEEKRRKLDKVKESVRRSTDTDAFADSLENPNEENEDASSDDEHPWFPSQEAERNGSPDVSDDDEDERPLPPDSDSESDASEGTSSFSFRKEQQIRRLEETLQHSKRLRILQERLDRQKAERSKGRRRSIRAEREDGRTIKISKWFIERKK